MKHKLFESKDHDLLKTFFQSEKKINLEISNLKLLFCASIFSGKQNYISLHLVSSCALVVRCRRKDLQYRPNKVVVD